MGIVLEHAIPCGTLPPIYVYASDNLVSPIVVVVAEAPTTEWKPDLLEVDRVIELPIEVLKSKRSRVDVTTTRRIRCNDLIVGEFEFRAPAFKYGASNLGRDRDVVG
jgi:hypothetical protein